MGWEEQVREEEARRGLDPVTGWGGMGIDALEEQGTALAEFSSFSSEPATPIEEEREGEEGSSLISTWQNADSGWATWPSSTNSGWMQSSVDSSWHAVDDSNYNIGAGLYNLGNTCYLNSVLQCLTYTVPLVEALRSSRHQTPCTIPGFCVLCALRDHVDLSLSSTGKAIDPSVFVDNLSKMSSSFQKWAQEDAHDYLHSLLEGLDDCVLGMGHFNPISFFQGSSFVKRIFGGSLRSQISCKNCLHSSDSFEPFIDLSLEINEADTLRSALECFTGLETIDYHCENCHQSEPFLKQLTISEPPDVLIIQLKRFASNGYFDEKIQKMVAYPQVLDMEPFVSRPQVNKVDLQYELYAVLVHAGFTLNSGHYYCFVRSTYDEWYEMDDSQVKRVSEDTFMSQEAYILFYFRQGLPWFSEVSDSLESILEQTAASDDSSRYLSEVVLEETSETTETVEITTSDVSSHDLSEGDNATYSNANFSLSATASQSSVPASSCISHVENHSDCRKSHSASEIHSDSREGLSASETHSDSRKGHSATKIHSDSRKGLSASEIHSDSRKRLSASKIHDDSRKGLSASKIHDDSRKGLSASEIHSNCRKGKGLALVNVYLKTKGRQRQVMTGKGKFCCGSASSSRVRRHAKSANPSLKLKRSSLSSGVNRACVLDNDSCSGQSFV